MSASQSISPPSIRLRSSLPDRLRASGEEEEATWGARRSRAIPRQCARNQALLSKAFASLASARLKMPGLSIDRPVDDRRNSFDDEPRQEVGVYPEPGTPSELSRRA
eukprot:758721-Hanusia_phi.AAC.3